VAQRWNGQSAVSEEDLREQLNRQSSRMQRLEEDLRNLNAVVRIVDRDMPVMLAYLDSGERYRFHNHAYRRWLGLSAEQISGRSMREVLGATRYAHISAHVKHALAGAPVQYDREHVAATGERIPLLVHLVPSFSEQRTVTGFYSLTIHGAKDAVAPAEQSTLPIEPLGVHDAAADAPELVEGRVERDLAEWRSATQRIKAALRGNEFELHAQAIEDLGASVLPFQGIVIRHREEEESLLPPGAFFEIAQYYGLMSELDRWVVTGVLDWIAARRRAPPMWKPSMYFVRLSRDSVADPYFPDFVQQELIRTDALGEMLCFEIQQEYAIELAVDTIELMRNLRTLGCRTMLGGFGRDKVHLELLRDMQFDFIGIDGSLVLRIARDPAALAKLQAIVRLGHAVGINTVAELVESPEILARLRASQVDYAQGSAVTPAVALDATS
jgi:PAS domain S-box-containing protein